MKFLTIFIALVFSNIVSAQDWSDTMDLNENAQTAFMDDSKRYGYMCNGKVVIKPTFQEAYNFHGDYANAKLKGRWGVISKKGKWILKPTYDFISPVVNDQCILYNDSTFYVKTIDGEKTKHGHFLKIDYLKYLELIKTSHDPDRELVLRVAQMYDPVNSNHRHENPDRIYTMLSRHLIKFYWSTKWVLAEGLLK